MITYQRWWLQGISKMTGWEVPELWTLPRIPVPQDWHKCNTLEAPHGFEQQASSIDKGLARLVWALSQTLETLSNSKEGQQTSRMPKAGFPPRDRTGLHSDKIKGKLTGHSTDISFMLKYVLLIHAHFRSLRNSKWFNLWVTPEVFRRHSGSQGTKGDMNKVTACVLCICPRNTFATLTSTNRS